MKVFENAKNIELKVGDVIKLQSEQGGEDRYYVLIKTDNIYKAFNLKKFTFLAQDKTIQKLIERIKKYYSKSCKIYVFDGNEIEIRLKNGDYLC